MNILELIDIDRSYGRNKVLDGLNIRVPKGSIYGFLGRNGTGKTTTIKIILGLIKHHGGSIKINGAETSYKNASARGCIGSIVEFPGFYPNLDAHDNLKVFQWLYGCYDRSRIDDVLNIVGLSDAGGKKAGLYSLGMKQRLGLARALLADPDILVLDEPNNGLDPSGIIEMRKLLTSLCRQYGKTIFLSSHILSEIEQIVDIVGIVKDGKMAEEISIEALRKKCIKGLKIRVSDPDSAVGLLKRGGNLLPTYNERDGTVVIGQDADAGEINGLLVSNGFKVSMLQTSSQSLEEYFLDITA